MQIPIKAQIADKSSQSPRPESERERINALGRLYLDAGLPLAAAFEAALADYVQGFAPAERGGI